jgi:hypothetical protein
MKKMPPPRQQVWVVPIQAKTDPRAETTQATIENLHWRVSILIEKVERATCALLAQVDQSERNATNPHE